MEITDLNSLIKAVEQTTTNLGGQIWWRGHSISDWDLDTRLYREDKIEDEHNLCFLFRNEARVRYEKCPQYGDSPEWLSLMQHYGLPTRLLDWSESCTVALFFAINELNHHDKPGSLWGISPSILNKCQFQKKSVFTAESVKPIFQDAFNPPDKKKFKKICGILSSHFDLRHLVQSSVFTLHGISTPLNKLEGCDAFLEQHTIPISAKPYLFHCLGLMRFSEKFIFPDLSHLANDISGKHYF